ncbi:hypothetical protein K435DRAFT_860373 [Dendrothele bispora CBS 962.96]|uniref:Uncharacterized protein n=1 Tax=Dendrothele bispora (strain CBS 962.96) TaxID=1314807 RepID=A0A4S8LZ98_DENBC|nr:hypothetical protein K435DRAFT_860373 [Dendrothele bispora CBS 962.96]
MNDSHPLFEFRQLERRIFETKSILTLLCRSPISQPRQIGFYSQPLMELTRAIQEAQVFVEHCHSFGADIEQVLSLIEVRAVKRCRRSLEEAYYSFSSFNDTSMPQSVRVVHPYQAQDLTPDLTAQPSMPGDTPSSLSYVRSNQSMNVEFFSNAEHIRIDGSSINNIRGNQTQSWNSGMQSWGNVYILYNV